MKNIIEIVYFGYGILIIAALINWLGKLFNFKSWYDVLLTGNFRDLSFINMLWLGIIYPLLLGIGVFLLIKLRNYFG